MKSLSLSDYTLSCFTFNRIVKCIVLLVYLTEDSDSTRETRRSKSNNNSRSSTPVGGAESSTDTRSAEHLERKLGIYLLCHF